MLFTPKVKYVFILITFSFHLVTMAQIDTSWNPSSLRIIKNKIFNNTKDSILQYFSEESLRFFSYGLDSDANKITLRDSVFKFVKKVIEKDLQNSQSQIIIPISDSLKSSFIAISNKINFYSSDSILAPQTSNEIIKVLEKFPISKEKVLLTLFYEDYPYKKGGDLFSIGLVFQKAISEAEKISNIVERAEAYDIIGTFFSVQKIDLLALQSYYCALTYAYTERLDSISFYNFAGSINEQIGNIFPGIFSHEIYNIQKQSNYYLTAYDFYKKGNNIRNANFALSKYFSNYAFLYYTSTKNELYTLNDTSNEVEVLNLLQTKYLEGRPNKNSLTENSLWFNAIGLCLLSENRFEQSSTYFVSSLVWATINHRKDELKDDLYYVALSYAFQGKKSFAIQYINLLEEISNNSDSIVNETYLSKLFLRKAEIYCVLKKYDSSINYLNKIIENSERLSKGYNEERYNTIASAYELKCQIIKILHLDSLWYYEAKYHEIKKLEIDHWFLLILMESNFIASWFKDVKSWEVSTTKEKNNKLEELRNQLTTTNIRLFIAIVILGILITGILFINSKRRKQSRIIQENLGEQIALRNILSHDVKRLLEGIPFMTNKILHDYNFPAQVTKKLIPMSNAAKYVSAVLKMNQEPTSSLEDQIELSKLYAETFLKTQLTPNHSIVINKRIKDQYILHELLLPTFLINNFVKNAIEHGFADEKFFSLVVDIEVHILTNGFAITINDDGCGIKYAQLNGGTQGKGIQYALESIAFYNSSKNTHRITFSEKSIVDKSELHLGRGTLVTLKIFKK